MRKLVGIATISLACCVAMNANESKEEFFGYSGSVGTFSKIGFNDAKIDTQKGIYPTDTFTTLFGRVDTTYNFKSFFSSDSVSVLKAGLGIAGGALIYDSTRYDGQSELYSNGSGLNKAYVGAWYGNGGVGGAAGGVRNYILQNAFIDFQSEYFNLKGGRYESGWDYFSGFTQGFQADVHFSVSDADALKFWWFSSWGRAFAYSQWFLDFYAPKSSTKKNGDAVNLGIHAGGLDYTHGTITTDNGVKSGMSVLVRPWTQFYPSLFNAAGGKIDYQQYFGNGYGVGVIAQGYALTAIKKGGDALNDKVDDLSGNLNVILQGFINEYTVRLGFYKNFGSAGAHIGTYGNPLGIDQWTGSVYDIGPSLNDITSRNAFSVYLSGGGSHSFEVGTFSWEILGRYTTAPRSDEASIALWLKQAFNNGFALGLKLEWLNDTTKAGYNTGAGLGDKTAKSLSAKRTDDRSHAFITLDYNF